MKRTSKDTDRSAAQKAGRKAAPKASRSRSAVATSEDEANLKLRVRAIVRGLAKMYPVAECALRHESAFQLLVATILSAQCTDERVNMATPELFRRYPDAESLAASRQEDVEKLVQSLGFFRNKAANIRGMAQKVVTHHGGEIPCELEQLVNLPGVGRKTANVLLGTWFKVPSGVVVDTHVRRITNLLGLTQSQNPEIIEREMMELIPRNEWINFSHRLVHHGRKLCIANRPKCTSCMLLRHCRRTGLKPLTDAEV
ncbi:MAG: endonuclease III [Planctomyces sp.]